MAEITTYKSVTMRDLFSRIDQVKDDPTLSFRASIDVFDEVTGGSFDIVDPSNPFVLLLSTSAVMAAANAQEMVRNIRKQFPSLAQSEEDLYLHMSDRDYMDRFATPASASVSLVLQWQQLQTAMVRSDTEDCKKVTVPRDTTVTVDGIVFMMQYPIDIKLFDNGVLVVSYDNTITSPLMSLTTNIIPARVRTDNDGGSWLMFDVKVLQTSVSVVEDTIQKSKPLTGKIVINQAFYCARAFYQHQDTGSVWHEFRVTHTDQVYDPFKPTMCLKVFSDSVEYRVPTVYQHSGLIAGSVRVLVYTTGASVSLNFDNYNVDSFKVQLQAIDEPRDLTVYTAALAKVSIHAMVTGTVNGGTDAITLEVLRDRVMRSSTGTPVVPITNVQAKTLFENHGFELVRNADTLTNRIFLATQKLPPPSNPKLLTSANVAIGTLMVTLDALMGHPRVRVNGKRWTLLSENLYKDDNGIISIVQPMDFDALTVMERLSLASHVNSSRYLYSPFHYVLDNTEVEFTTRAYYLDAPVANNLNFKRQNQSLQLVVNTGSYYVEKAAFGYRLFVTVESGNFYKQLPDNTVSAQLSFPISAGDTFAFINAEQVGLNERQERIFRFDIKTNFDIDLNHHVVITNALVQGVGAGGARCALQSRVRIMYTTTSLTPNYKPDATTDLLGVGFLPVGSAAITLEELDVTFGWFLKNMWTRSRTLPTGVTYDRYTQNIPMTYTEDVYDRDPITGSIFEVVDNKLFYKKLHSKGDVVYDSVTNEVVFKHRAGDVVLDAYGEPIVITTGQENKEVDMLFVDGRYYFTTDPIYKQYNLELSAILNEWITQDLGDIQQVLLEQTRVYFYPKNQLGMVEVLLVDGQSMKIRSEQSFVLDLDVDSVVYNSLELREQLETKTIKLLDEYIAKTEVNLVEIQQALSGLYGNAVKSFTIQGLGGESNLRYMRLKSEEHRLCLKRDLKLLQDNSLVIDEDVTFNFHWYDTVIN